MTDLLMAIESLTKTEAVVLSLFIVGAIQDLYNRSNLGSIKR